MLVFLYPGREQFHFFSEKLLLYCAENSRLLGGLEEKYQGCYNNQKIVRCCYCYCFFSIFYHSNIKKKTKRLTLKRLWRKQVKTQWENAANGHKPNQASQLRFIFV